MIVSEWGLDEIRLHEREKTSIPDVHRRSGCLAQQNPAPGQRRLVAGIPDSSMARGGGSEAARAEKTGSGVVAEEHEEERSSEKIRAATWIGRDAIWISCDVIEVYCDVIGVSRGVVGVSYGVVEIGRDVVGIGHHVSRQEADR